MNYIYMYVLKYYNTCLEYLFSRPHHNAPQHVPRVHLIMSVKGLSFREWIRGL